MDLWLGEGALHASSGVNGVTNTFVSTLWYAHTLGQLARSGVGMLSRQTLLGGDYELVITFQPMIVSEVDSKNFNPASQILFTPQ